MEFSAKQIAELLNGTIEGNENVTVNNLSKIEEGKPNTLSFLGNPNYAKYIYDTNASIVIINNNFELEGKVKDTCTLIRVEDAYKCFAKLLDAYNQAKQPQASISKNASIAESASIGNNVYIGDFVCVGKNVKIGDNVQLHPHSWVGDNVEVKENTILNSGVRVYHDCVIGKNCIIHAGSVIGADGFGFTPNSENNYQKIAQIGNVVIEDNVEIGALTSVDRATLGSTIIEKGVKLDNHIQIGHNAVIGENTVIAAQTGVSGSTKIGKNCMIGGQVGIVGHITIADEVKIAAQSGIGKSITKKGDIVQGSPAYFIGDFKRSYVGFIKLPQIMKRLDELEKRK